jgi:RNA polymerase sigma factor (sigma-70 family)
VDFGNTSLGGAQQEFPKTVWDVVCRARDGDEAVRREALGELCARYWKPVYHYIRAAWAKSNDDAKDLTQAFFVWLMEGETLSRYEPERASFRAYLKGLLKNFVRHQDEALRRLKRGGGKILELDGSLSSLKELLPGPESDDPEKIFDRVWRSTLVSVALGRVRQRMAGLPFQVYEAYEMLAPAMRPTYADLARRFGIKEKDVDNHLFAVRQEVRSEVRREIEAMTRDSGDVEREWDVLFGS